MQTVVVGWQARRWRPAAFNLGRALAALRGGAQAVLLVRGTGQRAYRHALYPTDFSSASLDGLRQALRVLPRMRLTLLHLCRMCGERRLQAAGVSVDTLDACRRRAEGAARAAGVRFAARAACESRLALLMLRQPRTLALAGYANMVRPDVLVLPAGPAGRWRGAMWRAALRTVLARTDCDVLLLA